MADNLTRREMLQWMLDNLEYAEEWTVRDAYHGAVVDKLRKEFDTFIDKKAVPSCLPYDLTVERWKESIQPFTPEQYRLAVAFDKWTYWANNEIPEDDKIIIYCGQGGSYTADLRDVLYLLRFLFSGNPEKDHGEVIRFIDGLKVAGYQLDWKLEAFPKIQLGEDLGKVTIKKFLNGKLEIVGLPTEQRDRLRDLFGLLREWRNKGRNFN